MVNDIRRVNVSSIGLQANGDARDPDYADPYGTGVNERGPEVSDDGRFVAYTSFETNHGGGTSLVTNVFLKDLETGSLDIVSRRGSALADQLSYNASITPDGRYVLFTSLAANLVSGDTNGKTDIFRYDVAKGALVRVSTNGSVQGDGRCDFGSMSDDGQSVAFYSYWNTAVAGATTRYDVLLRSAGGKLVRASTSSSGAAADDHSKMPALSGDGKYVAFVSEAGNLVGYGVGSANQVYRKNLQTGAVEVVSKNAAGAVSGTWSYAPDISTDGHAVAFYTYAAFDARDAAWSDIYVKDMNTGALRLASANAAGEGGNDSSYLPSLSGDGRFVVFYSAASNLVAGDTNGKYDVFVKDLQTGRIAAVSTAADGSFGNGSSYAASISSNGRWIAFYSRASNLVAGDTNGAQDVFVVDNPLDSFSTYIEGSDGDDTLTGSEGNETLVGGLGDDVLNGGGGRDWLLGGAGDDIYGVDNSGDRVEETVNCGTDTVRASVAWTLADHLENLVLEGTARTGTGNGLANRLTGGAGKDALAGLAGNDTLDGGLGADVLAGGDGDDFYLVDNAGDKIVDSAGIDGIATALAKYSLAKFSSIENLSYTGAAAFIGTGNALANTLAGAGGNDKLDGGAGDDSLWGGAGGDLLAGGDGDDRLHGGDGADTLIGGKGADSFCLDAATDAGTDLFADFRAGEDKIVLARTGFDGLPATLTGADFLAGAGASMAASGQRLIYDSAAGILYYDGDGTAATPALQLAIIGKTSHPALSISDFVLA